MTETSVGHWGFPGFTVKKSTVMRAVLLVFTTLILLAAGCAAEKPTLVVSGGPPKIPHSLEGRDQCLMCHESGVAGAPRVPANHVGRTSDICRLCHVQGAGNGGHEAAPSGTAPAVASGAAAAPLSQAAAGNAGPGSIQNGQDVYGKFCNGCHPGGKAGVGPALIGMSDATIKAAVRQGKGGMPAFAAGQISDAQLADLAAYVTGLK